MNYSQPQDEIFYSALSRRDSSFEGIFVVAVKTTKVFCRPTCSARMPKRENVEFFSSSVEALAHGYRPCKICKPMEYKGSPPEWLKPLMDELDNAPPTKLKDSRLRERGFDPNRGRYWFKKQHSVTFQGYLRALRVGQAFGRIKHGDGVAETAFETGYNSLSGFADSFKKVADFSPGKSQENQLVATTKIFTPLGPMLAGATEQGICLLEFMDREILDAQIKRLSQLMRARFLPGTSAIFEDLKKQLDEYFAGRREFSLPLLLTGTAFQVNVLDRLKTIPYGITHSYKQQAECLGMSTAVRAVAKANADNNIAILLPCH